MSPSRPISGHASPVAGSSSPPRSSVHGSAPSPLLSKVLHPSTDRIHNFPKSGLADKEGISCTNSPDLFSTSPFDPSSSSAPFLTPSSPDMSVPRPMPFFGGTIIFVPTKTDPSHPVILPTLPTPSSSPPPADTNPIGLKCHARARIPTPHGHVFLHLYKTNQDAKEHLAIVFDPVQMDDAAGAQNRDHIRSRSLDAVWRDGETEMERLIRGAYVGRLSHAGGKASVPTAPQTVEEEQGTQAAPPPTPLVRIHSECFTGETLGSQRCDCGEQLDESLRLISLPTLAPQTSSSPPSSSPSLVPGRGVIVYLRQEGRGIGLLSKLLAYNLQDLGHDTVEANLALGHGADERKWDVAGGILADLGFGPEGEGVRLMTNNPGKVEGLRGEGVSVVERVGMIPRAWDSYGAGTENGGEEEKKAVGPLSLALEGQFHPEVKKEEREREAERREWMARRSGVGMIGGGETRSEELDRYLKTKVERMGHILELPKD